MLILTRKANLQLLANLKAYIEFCKELYGNVTVLGTLGVTSQTLKNWEKQAVSGTKQYPMATFTKISEKTSIPMHILLARTVTFEAALAEEKKRRRRTATKFVKIPGGLLRKEVPINNFRYADQ